MIIKVNDEVHLEFFNKICAAEFFNTIHQDNSINDYYRANLQRKYSSPEVLINIIEDAVENKFKVDGTPDFFIRYKGKIAGMFEFHPLTGNDFIEVGYWLYPEFRKKGILRVVFPVMINYAKEKFSKKTMLATTSVENIPSQKLLESQHFTKVGLNEEMRSDGTIERQNVYKLVF